MAQTIKQVPTSNSLSYTLDSGYSAGGTTLVLNQSVAGTVQAPGVVVVDRIDSSGNKTPTKRTYYYFTGVSSATLTGVSVADGTDQSHGIGAIVEFTPDVKWAQSIYDALTQTVVASTGVLDTTKVVDLTTAQVLTNKDISSATNTMPATLAPKADPTFTGTVTEPKVQGAGSAAQFPQVVGEYDNGNSGTSKAIDWSKGDRQLLTVTGSATLTFSNAVKGQTLTLRLVIDGTGGYTATVFPTLKWPGATAVTPTMTANAINLFIFYFDGTNYLAQGAANFS